MNIRKDVLPVLKPLGGEEEINALADVIRSGWWGKGPKVKDFEEKFASMVGAKYAIAVSSATHGQDIVLKALELKDGDVINPTISFMTTAVVPLWNNLESNIVDVQRDTLNIDPKDVKKSLTKNTKAIIAVNMAGIPAPISELRKIFDGPIIEDTAHSCYTEGAGRQGDVAVWSFQAVKTMPCGDGGMITTDDKELYEKLIPMTWMGISSTYSRVSKASGGVSKGPGYSWDYDVHILNGRKCYMTDLTAAICLEQMKKLSFHLDKRRHIQKRYNEELHELVTRPEHSETVQYYCSRVPAQYRNELMDYLSSKKIHTSVHFKPLHKFSILKQKRDYPVADTEWLKLISLPVHPAMTEFDIDYVVFWVNEFFKLKSKTR